MIYALMAFSAILALLVVGFISNYIRQCEAAAALAAHREYQHLVNGLDKDANTLKVEIITKYEAAVKALEDGVK